MREKFSRIFFILLSVLTVCFISSCYYDVEEELYPDPPTGPTCDTVNVSYGSFVNPTFQNSCVSCHNDVSLNGGFSLESYAAAKDYLDQPGKPDVFIQRIAWPPNLPSSLRMPQGQPKLPDCTVTKISAWINAGYPQN